MNINIIRKSLLLLFLFNITQSYSINFNSLWNKLWEKDNITYTVGTLGGIGTISACTYAYLTYLKSKQIKRENWNLNKTINSISSEKIKLLKELTNLNYFEQNDQIREYISEINLKYPKIFNLIQDNNLDLNRFFNIFDEYLENKLFNEFVYNLNLNIKKALNYKNILFNRLENSKNKEIFIQINNLLSDLEKIEKNLKIINEQISLNQDNIRAQIKIKKAKFILRDLENRYSKEINIDFNNINLDNLVGFATSNNLENYPYISYLKELQKNIKLLSSINTDLIDKEILSKIKFFNNLLEALLLRTTSSNKYNKELKDKSDSDYKREQEIFAKKVQEAKIEKERLESEAKLKQEINLKLKLEAQNRQIRYAQTQIQAERERIVLERERIIDQANIKDAINRKEQEQAVIFKKIESEKYYFEQKLRETERELEILNKKLSGQDKNLAEATDLKNKNSIYKQQLEKLNEFAQKLKIKINNPPYNPSLVAWLPDYLKDLNNLLNNYEQNLQVN